MSRFVTCLWFNREAEEAAEFYCSVFPDSRVLSVDTTPVDTPGPKAGDVVTVEFELDGRTFIALNGGSDPEYTDALSLEIRCRDQAEIDHYWNGLLAGGGQEVQCGWLIDRYGVRWQVAPESLYELWRGDDEEAAARSFAAMMDMVKLDIAALEAAARGD
ncbi:VOC family protein [Rhodococcus sp. IEGM 1408]|uniref:VOC family protein n=1 Tax=Rhodococcus sp. IEGM 1408 TaxID=3082220 RepID=UPI002953E847|nr:VOC family protein [Rhodococcus sp. IEGM 1408]MDV8000629.1 VOC family protein [Rhodococcus sp. IEGM 1408]